jgi:hypothetical protein
VRERSPKILPTSSESETLRAPLSQIKESDRLRLRKPPFDGIEDLAQKIKRDGQSTAMFVRQLKPGEYELISGYRRERLLVDSPPCTKIHATPIRRMSA